MDINAMPEEEIKKAFHEWAEGSEALEQLLNEGYNRGFLSHACCGGDTGRPYIDYELNDEQSRKIAICIAEKLIQSGLDCKVTIQDNFLLNEAYPEQFPTKEIISLNVQTLIENREEVFSSMSKYIKEAVLENVKLPQTENAIPRKEFKKAIQPNNTIKKHHTFADRLQSMAYPTEEIAGNDAKEMNTKTQKGQIPTIQKKDVII